MAIPTGPDWIRRDRNVIEGLDHLGVEIVSANLYQAMLPGLTNVTHRIRYYSFYAWVIHRFAQDGPSVRSRENWVSWIRAMDFTYALACRAHEGAVDGISASSVVGRELATELLRGKAESAWIDFRDAVKPHKDRGHVYFKNSQGGFGQYYRVPMVQMGIVSAHVEEGWPDVKLTKSAGLVLAEELDTQPGFDQLQKMALAGRARVVDLAGVGATVHPSALRPRSVEATALRALVFGTDSDTCKHQQPSSAEWRRASLRLMLDYASRQNVPSESRTDDFRWSCYTRSLPSGKKWQNRADLEVTRRSWCAYQLNDILNHCLEALLFSLLHLIDSRSLTPVEASGRLATRAAAGVSSPAAVRCPALSGNVKKWLEGCEHAIDPTDLGEWLDHLQELVEAKNIESIPAIVARILGHIAIQRPNGNLDAFEPIPGALAMAESFNVHLPAFIRRAESCKTMPVKEFLADVILHWIVYRHLTVATRKLASQGVSTYKFRPEEGRLVPVTLEPPEPTWTMPRISVGFRMLEDLGCIERNTENLELTKIGVSLLEPANA